MSPPATLRPLSLSDALGLLGVIERNRVFFRRYLSWVDSVQTLADSRAFIQQNIDLAATGKVYVCTIFDRDTPIGLIGFNRIDHMHKTGEISYWLDAAYHGRGIATRACREMIEFGWKQLNLHRIVLLINTDNHSSRAIAERLGFRPEGVHRESFWMYDRYADQVCYALLQPEWRSYAGNRDIC